MDNGKGYLFCISKKKKWRGSCCRFGCGFLFLEVSKWYKVLSGD